MTDHERHETAAEPLSHSQLVAYALESLRERHLAYLNTVSGSLDRNRRTIDAVGFWTDLRREVRQEIDARPDVAPAAWLDALGLYLAFVLAGAGPVAPGE